MPLSKWMYLQLTLRLPPNNLDSRPPIAQADLPALDLGHEPDLLETLPIPIAHPPHLRDKRITRLDGAREPGTKHAHIGRLITSQLSQHASTSTVPTKKPMDNGASKAHLPPGLRRRVQRVIVAVEPVQQRRELGGLVLVHSVRLAPRGRRVVLCFWSFGPAPVALAHEKPLAHGPAVDFVCGAVDECLLGLDDGARRAFVVDAEDAGADLVCAVGGGRGERFVEGYGALAVDDTSGVEGWDPGNRGPVGRLGCVEIDDVGGLSFEGQDYGVGWEGGEGGVEFVEKVQ